MSCSCGHAEIYPRLLTDEEQHGLYLRHMTGSAPANGARRRIRNPLVSSLSLTTMSDVSDEIRTITCTEHAQAAVIESMTDGVISIRGCCTILLERVEQHVTEIGELSE